MIQRIQSLYLVFILVGIVLMCMFPVARYTFDMEGIAMKAQLNVIAGSSNASETVISQEGFINSFYLPIAVSVLALLTLITLFMYKNRMLQVKLIAVAVLVNLAYIGLLFFWAIDSFAKALEVSFKTTIQTNYFVGAFIPLVTLLLFVLAQRAIKSDERLVRSADRLR